MAYLIVEKGSNKGASHELPEEGEVLVGRSKEADFQIKDRFVSRKHFHIEIEDETYILKDLDSDNGTFVNGEAVEREQLEDGDHLQVGETHLSFISEESHQEREDLIGETVGGHEILERIGRGGMGTVYKARQVSLDRVVALKILASDLVEDEKFVEQFLSEARSAATLNHPNVTKVYDVGDDDGVYFLSMEYIRGGSLHDLLSERDILEPERAAEIALDISRALEYARRKELVHRDIKPGNIMLTEEGNAKLIDLGIAKQGRKEWEDEGMMVGTPDYMAPEQATEESVDTKADIYALGVTLYRMVTGERPIKGQSSDDVIKNKFEQDPIPPSSKNEDVPKWLSSLIMDMIRVDPAQRIATPDKVIDRIERGMADKPSVLTMKGVKRLAKKKIRPRRWPLFAGAAAVLLLILGVTYFFATQNSSRDIPDENGPVSTGKRTGDGKDGGSSGEEEEDTNETEKDPAKKYLENLKQLRADVEENPSEELFEEVLQKHQSFKERFPENTRKKQVSDKINQLKRKKKEFLLNKKLADLQTEFTSLKSRFRTLSPVTMDEIGDAEKLLDFGNKQVMGVHDLQTKLNGLIEAYSSVASNQVDEVKREIQNWYQNKSQQLGSFQEILSSFTRKLDRERFREAADQLESNRTKDLFQSNPFKASLNELVQRFQEQERQFYYSQTDEIVDALTENEFDRASDLISFTRETIHSEKWREKLAEEQEKIDSRKQEQEKQERNKRKENEREQIFKEGVARLVQLEARAISPEEAQLTTVKELKFEQNDVYWQIFKFLARQYQTFFQILGNRAPTFNHNIINDKELGQVEITSATTTNAELDIPNVSATSNRSWSDFDVPTLLGFVYENKGDLTAKEKTALATMYYLFDHVDGVSGNNLQELIGNGELSFEDISRDTALSVLQQEFDQFQNLLINTLIEETRQLLAKGRGGEALRYSKFLRDRFQNHSYYKAHQQEIENLFSKVQTFHERQQRSRIISWPIFIREHVEYFRNNHLPRIEKLLEKMNFRMEYKRRGKVLFHLGRYEKSFQTFEKLLPENWLQKLKQGNLASTQHRAQFYKQFYKTAVLAEKSEEIQNVLRTTAVQRYRAGDTPDSQEQVQKLRNWKTNLREKQNTLKEEKFAFTGGTEKQERLIRIMELFGTFNIPNLKKKFILTRSIIQEYPQSKPVKSGRLLLQSAKLLMALGDYPGARSRFKRFVRSYPDHDRVSDVSSEEGWLQKCKHQITYYSLR